LFLGAVLLSNPPTETPTAKLPPKVLYPQNTIKSDFRKVGGRAAPRTFQGHPNMNFSFPRNKFNSSRQMLSVRFVFQEDSRWDIKT